MKFLRSFFPSTGVVLACALTANALTVKPNVAPVVSNQISSQSVYSETTRIIDLSSFFSDPDASAAARLVTPLGTMNFTLDGATTPITVANFLNYVNSGRYFKPDPINGQLASTFFHRSVANFVIQAGGFLGTVSSTNASAIAPTQVLTFPAIQNEPFISNRRGTIAMAKLGNDPNSATSQWFINLADNSGGGSALDTQNGGFTVFGRVAGTGMATADAIAALPRYDFSNSGSAFGELPLRDYDSHSVVKVSNLASIPEFAQISPFEFSASSNNPAAVGVRVSGTNLLVDALQPGAAAITVTASDLDGATVSQSFNVNVTAPPGRLLNISTRANFPTGNDVLIAGFILESGSSKQIVVRAAGPSLADRGIANALPDPTLELHDGSGALLAQNDNWGDDANSKLLSDFGLAPASAKEAALVATLPASSSFAAYTAVVRSATGESGVGLVEVFDVASGPSPSILNLSTRGEVGTGGDVLIGGFFLRGSNSRRLIVRARGPSLTQQNVSGVLPDPKIELRDAQGTVLDSNDNWQTNPNAAEIQSDNLAPTDPNESAVIITLASGPYTAIISGAGNQPTGVALVELYQVQ